MGKYICNGFLVQDVNAPTVFASKFNYKGITSFHLFPLDNINSTECLKLSEKQQFKRLKGNSFQSLEFITNYDFLCEYLLCCEKHNIITRTLFIESSYALETYNDRMPLMKFLGYELCPIPIDEQIITDLDWYPQFYKYHSKLNEFGLFSSYLDALKFKVDYEVECKKNIIGDGVGDYFICKVFSCENNQII